MVGPGSSYDVFSKPREPLGCRSLDELVARSEQLAASGTEAAEALVLDSDILLVRRAAFDAVGGLDPALRELHYALPDLCLRLRRAGWLPYIVSTAYVHENVRPAGEDADAATFREKHGFDCFYSCNTRPELLRHVQLAPDHPAVLEVGCACGGNLLQLRAQRPDVELCGVELSEASAAVARQFAQIHAIDIETLHQPAWEGKFDAVILGDLLEHLRDPWQTLRRIHRVLRPGGRVIISVPNVMHISNLGRLLRHGDWHYASSGILDRTHLRFFTRKTAAELVAQAGCRVIAVEPRIFAQKPQWAPLRAQILPLLGPDVAPENLDALQWVVVGEK